MRGGGWNGTRCLDSRPLCLAVANPRLIRGKFDNTFICFIVIHKFKMFYFQKYLSDGSHKKKQQLYQNVTNQPLITGDAGKLVLKILAVPELHLLIG